MASTRRPLTRKSIRFLPLEVPGYRDRPFGPFWVALRSGRSLKALTLAGTGDIVNPHPFYSYVSASRSVGEHTT